MAPGKWEQSLLVTYLSEPQRANVRLHWALARRMGMLILQLQTASFWRGNGRSRVTEGQLAFWHPSLQGQRALLREPQHTVTTTIQHTQSTNSVSVAPDLMVQLVSRVLAAL